MTYFGFLFWFLVLPLLALFLLARRDQRLGKSSPDFNTGGWGWVAIALHVLLAVVYTTPWDNYLVATGVWYYDPELVSGILLGWVPLEEYIFFALEPVLAGLWWWFLARRLSPAGVAVPDRKINFSLTAILLGVWAVALAVFIFGPESFTYLTLILIWILPAFILQIAYGADLLWHHRKIVAWAILPMGLYLSATDALAISDGIWTIAPAQSLGIKIGVLPLEEAVFFFVTVVLIVCGLTLSLSRVSQARLKNILDSWLRVRGGMVRLKNPFSRDQGW